MCHAWSHHLYVIHTHTHACHFNALFCIFHVFEIAGNARKESLQLTFAQTIVSKFTMSRLVSMSCAANANNNALCYFPHSHIVLLWSCWSVGQRRLGAYIYMYTLQLQNREYTVHESKKTFRSDITSTCCPIIKSLSLLVLSSNLAITPLSYFLPL